ncbi:hypothetical protein ABE073_04865 [Lederbergia citrisecunda]|uniref:hypothetical protein n=1 Tax=Lederbergia citrisecunda TaxID=2833583 RepID=UPI003D2C7F31
MLKQLPIVGEFVEILKDGVWDDTNLRYQTKGDIHQIVGISPISGAAYFIGDTGREIYIDEAAFGEYRLADKKVELPEENTFEGDCFLDDVSVTLIKVSSDIEIIESTFGINKDVLGEITFKMSIGGDEFAMEAIAELEKDIRKLLVEKYHG